MVWFWLALVFFVGSGLFFLVKAQRLEKAKKQYLFRPKEPQVAAEIIKKSIASSFGRIPSRNLWVEIKGDTLVIQFDFHLPQAESIYNKNPLTYQKINRKIFKRANTLLLSALSLSASFNWLNRVIVSAYNVKYDKLGNFHKVCLLSLKSERDSLGSVKEAKGFGLVGGYQGVFGEARTRFFIDKDFVLRQVVPFERELEEELERKYEMKEGGKVEEIKEKILDEATVVNIVKDELSHSALRDFACELISNWGYKSLDVVREGLGEADLVARKDDNGEVAVVRVRQAELIDRGVVEAFYQAVQQKSATKGYFITDGTFSLEAQSWAESKEIELLDRASLLEFLESWKETESLGREEAKSLNKKVERVTAKCASCGWTYDSSLNRCPNCESTSIEGFVTNKEGLHKGKELFFDAH